MTARTNTHRHYPGLDGQCCVPLPGEAICGLSASHPVHGPQPVVAPQLHPDDTPRWDPQRQLADVRPVSDDEVRAVLYAVTRRGVGSVAAMPVLAILARLRRAELELAHLRADALRRSAVPQ